MRQGAHALGAGAGVGAGAALALAMALPLGMGINFIEIYLISFFLVKDRWFPCKRPTRKDRGSRNKRPTQKDRRSPKPIGLTRQTDVPMPHRSYMTDPPKQ